MAIKKGSVVVGHVPRKISAVCSLFLSAGTITSIVTDSCQYSNDLPQGRLKVPCDMRAVIIDGLNIGDFVQKLLLLANISPYTVAKINALNLKTAPKYLGL